MPAKTWAIGEKVTAENFNTYLQDQVVATFTNATARTAAIPSPKKGQTTFLQDTNRLESWTGSTWVALSGDTTLRFRGATSVQTTDGAGWFVFNVNPGIGTFVTLLGMTGDDLYPTIIQSRADYAPGTTQIVFRVYAFTGAPYGNAGHRINWLLIDRI